MRSGIYFFKSEVQFRFSNSAQIARWIKSIIKKEGKTCGELSVIFCSDEFLLGINQQFLKHDYFTDIITFDYSSGKNIAGEIYISIDRVKDNATSLGVTFPQELKRVIIHGVLHLLGYRDSTKAQKQAMRLREDACLSLLPVPRGTKG
jgi:rRNA maturation RNase YbeY